MDNLQPKRLPEGDVRPPSRLFGKKARTSILITVTLALMLFVLLPLGLDRLSAANGRYVAAMADAAETPLPTATPLPTQCPLLCSDESPAPTSAVSVSEYSLLQLNDDYPTVQKLQSRLMELGYLESDEPGTLYNDSTASAVSLFQRAVGSTVNGVADAHLQETLYSTNAAPYDIGSGDTGADVKRIQLRLTELGYYDGKISSYFGVATADAVEAFQKKNGLTVDGKFDREDRDLLLSEKARPKIDPTPTPKPTKKPSSSSGSSSSSSGSSSSGSSSSGSSSSESGSSGGSYSASYSPSGIVSVAKGQLGKSYVRGEEGPNYFDCSGLVYFCLRTCGVSTSRLNAQSFSRTSKWTEIGSISDLQAGDFVFFCDDSSRTVNHTGVYVGGSRFVHASSSKGEVVTSTITSSYWVRNFICGRRVF